MCLDFLCRRGDEEDRRKPPPKPQKPPSHSNTQATETPNPQQLAGDQEKRGRQVSSESDGKADQISSHKDRNKDGTLISDEVPTSEQKKSDVNDVKTVKQISAASTATMLNGSSEQEEPKILHKTVNQTGESKEQGLDKPTELVGKDDEKVEKKVKKGYLFNRASKFGNGE